MWRFSHLRASRVVNGGERSDGKPSARRLLVDAVNAVVAHAGVLFFDLQRTPIIQIRALSP
jgi:hypothetical protein